MGCNICEELREFLENPASHGKIDCGRFQDAVTTDCTDHGRLLRDFHDFCCGSDEKIPESEDVGFIAYGEGRSVMLTQSVTRLGRCWNLSLVKRGQLSSHPGVGRILDQDWVDMKIAKRWKDECLTHHGNTCENPLKVWPTRPTWLIDIEQMCIVPGDNDAPYVALSYRYGSGFEFRLGEERLDRLRSPHALDEHEVVEQLTPIVKHAMHTTQQLGERFLWLDSLCIPAGDLQGRNAELNIMGAIYANAVVTIIAADEDAQVGIPGLRGSSGSRNLSQRIFSFGRDQIIVRRTHIFSLVTGTQFYERGWTYQEYAMSKRRLLFRSKEIHWECSRCVWHEDLEFGAEMDKYINQRLRVIMAGFPDSESLDHCIQNYNTRELTFDEDALAGLLGLLSIFSRSFTGGFLYGLAETQFERALCWRPCWEHTNLRRRVASGRSENERLSTFALPSWSWVGWQGLVCWDYDALRVNPRNNWFSETIPITQWYTWDVVTKKPLRKVTAESFERRDDRKRASPPLPEGWSRHPITEAGSFRGEPLLIPDGCGEYVYRHAGMPDEDRQYWFYPFPVLDTESIAQPQMPEQTPHIYCRTQRATIRACRDLSSEHQKIKFKNFSGKDIGSMQLHNHDQLQLFPAGTGGTNGGEDKHIEVVAICRSRRYSKEFNHDTRVYDKINDPKDTYKVLWVEWIDSIAYRLAGGSVNKADWEALELEDVELILG